MKLRPYDVRWIRALAANGKSYSKIQQMLIENGTIVTMETVARVVRKESWLEDERGLLQGERDAQVSG